MIHYRICNQFELQYNTTIMRLFLFICLFVSCTSKRPTDSSLPVLDLTRDYPVREINIHDIANVEYIPLETNDSSLLPQNCYNYYVSDKYIITSDIVTYETFIFDRTGQFIRKVAHHGPGDKEYISPFYLTIDFINEEFTVFDMTRLLTYSFDGTFRYSSHFERRRIMPLAYNYDQDNILMYNNDFNFETKRSEDEHPYYIINKKEGSMHPLHIAIPYRISPIVHHEFTFISGKLVNSQTETLPLHQLLKNGTDYLISDPALDTLYSFKKNRLTPIAVQYPSVRSSNPPTVISPFVYTDSYILFMPISVFYNASNPKKPYWDAPKLAWDRKSNEIEKWIIFNPDASKRAMGFAVVSNSCYDNMTVFYDSAENLLLRYNKGMLNGKLKDVSSRLNEEDNGVLTIIKYK